MLITRFITAAVLAPIAIVAIYLLPPGGYALAFFGVAALGAYEWAGLCNLTTVPQRLGYVAVLAVLVLGTWQTSGLMVPALWLVVPVWLAAMVTVLGYPQIAFMVRHRAVAAAAGLLIMWGAWIALTVIREVSPHWVVWLCCLAWSADIGAYFAGRWLGRRKLAPEVSPGKTWAGFWGGLATSLLACSVLQWQLLGSWNLYWLLVIALLVVISVFGDLFESVMKRAQGAKDSGFLLPGHGGVLDRIDSIIAALPFFALLISSTAFGPAAI